MLRKLRRSYRIVRRHSGRLCSIILCFILSSVGVINNILNFKEQHDNLVLYSLLYSLVLFGDSGEKMRFITPKHRCQELLSGQ